MLQILLSAKDSLIRGRVTKNYAKKFGVAPTLNLTAGRVYVDHCALYGTPMSRNPIPRIRTKFGENSSILGRVIAI